MAELIAYFNKTGFRKGKLLIREYIFDIFDLP